MFEYEDGICKKIKEAACLTDKELEAVEIALRLTACHDMLLNEALGLNKYENESDKNNQIDFGLKYAINKKY